MAAPLPGRHRGLIAVPHSRNEVTRDLRDLLSNGGGHKKRPSAQDRPLKICFTKRFAAIEDEAKSRFMTDLASLNAEHLRKIYFPKKTLPHTEIPNYQL